MQPTSSSSSLFLRYQVCKRVSRHIIALRQLTDGGWRLTTDSDVSFLQHRVSGQIVHLESYRGGWYLAIAPTSDDTTKMLRYVFKPDKREVLGVEDEEVIGGETDVKTLPDPVLPSVTERCKHNVTHTPFASWCEHCIKGRGASSHHLRRDPQLKLGVDRRRTISIDYCFLRVTETEAQQTVLCAVDSHTGYSNAVVVKAKGVNEEAVQWLKRVVQEVGCPTINLHSDDESSAKALTRALAQEAAKVVGGSTTATTTYAATGSHESNGRCERWVRTLEGMTRTLVSSCVGNGINAEGRHQFFQGVVRHAAFVYNRYNIRGGDEQVAALHTTQFTVRISPALF
jgi:hypothetical protein